MAMCVNIVYCLLAKKAQRRAAPCISDCRTFRMVTSLYAVSIPLPTAVTRLVGWLVVTCAWLPLIVTEQNGDLRETLAKIMMSCFPIPVRGPRLRTPYLDVWEARAHPPVCPGGRNLEAEISFRTSEPKIEACRQSAIYNGYVPYA